MIISHSFSIILYILDAISISFLSRTTTGSREYQPVLFILIFNLVPLCKLVDICLYLLKSTFKAVKENAYQNNHELYRFSLSLHQTQSN